MIVLIVAAVIGCVLFNAWLVMLAFGVLHSVFESIPAIGYLLSIAVTFALGVLGSFFRRD